jgi:hypothetical protein
MGKKSENAGGWSYVNTYRADSHCLYLVIALVLTACIPINRQNETATAVPVSPESALVVEDPSEDLDNETGTAVATPAVTPAPTGTEMSEEETAVALITAKLREIEGYDESVTIEVRKESISVPLPDLTFYAAWAMLPDAPAVHCALSGETAWCDNTEALENIVRIYDLGANPEQLGHEEWLALVSFFTYTPPLDSPENLERIAAHIPENEREKIKPPQINLPESGGIEISYYYEFYSYESYPSGPLGLGKLDFKATGDNTVTFQHRDVWLGPEEED